MDDTSKPREDAHPNNPLHGKTLQFILKFLLEKYGWGTLGREIKINCFLKDPSIKSSLTFLRKTPWAREKVEGLYLETISRDY
ncbi:MAG: transporter [Candidatus Lloydbacteria bacterium RIFCSPHIGHO2_02_FULL_50_13]|uniref:Transporter n=1 Tax=Candidatus Lloydbacteria bacterium RIFCSPHIGHO2_02_FULL_50_13 TaxID=1798661 RepID=A0A1G2CZJ3_9BACT|nr:MAG: transporter [Candidatus Lloydbacteria bacterium RIFCSPHIGHO2_02_FULL_50_13]